jgi:8-oxo-dGTP diphosphatase
MYQYEYPRPALTADAVVFAPNAEGKTTVLLIKRKNPPFQGRWALPGGFVDEGETTQKAAVRELLEETSLSVGEEKFEFVGLYDTPGRDPRGWTVSGAWMTKLDKIQTVKGEDDAMVAEWHPIEELPEMAFDHERVLREAIAMLGR